MWMRSGGVHELLARSNPNFFLIYTSSAATLITFVTSKYVAVQDLYKNGLAMIQNVLMGEISKKVGSIMSYLEQEKSRLLSMA